MKNNPLIPCYGPKRRVAHLLVDAKRLRGEVIDPSLVFCGGPYSGYVFARPIDPTTPPATESDEEKK